MGILKNIRCDIFPLTYRNNRRILYWRINQSYATNYSYHTAYYKQSILIQKTDILIMNIKDQLTTQ